MKKIEPKVAAPTTSVNTAAKTAAAAKSTVLGGLFETNETKSTKCIPGVNTGTAPTITKEQAKSYATELYDAMKGIGARGKKVDNILLNGGLNSYDIVSIINEYGSVSNHHFLTDDLASNFMGSHEDKLLQKVLESCIEVMADSNSDRTLQWRASSEVKQKTLEKYMVEQGYAEKDTSGIRTSDNVAGIRG